MSKEVVAEVIALIELGLIAPEDIVKCLRKANSEPEKALAEQPRAFGTLAQQQEPVAWMVDVDLANYQGQSEYRTILAWNAKPVWSGTHEVNEVLKAVPLYTSPPAAQRQWVGLTPREIYNLWEDSGVPFVDWDSFASIAQAIQAKLKEKNT